MCSCALGNLEAARMLLARAFAMNEYLKKKALDDPDLEPLWAEMGSQPPDTRS